MRERHSKVPVIFSPLLSVGEEEILTISVAGNLTVLYTYNIIIGNQNSVTLKNISPVAKGIR